MPTENRSSNNEMVSDLLPCPFCGEKPQITKHHREDIYSFMHRCQVLGPISWGFREDQQAHIEKWNARAQPAPQPHPEPIAWMVGTAIWWTKEEAERDAAATGLTIVGLGPMTATAPAEQRLGEPVELPAKLPGCKVIAAGWNQCLDIIGRLGPLYTRADPGEVERLREALAELKASYAEQEAQVAEDFRCIDDLRAQLAERNVLLLKIRRNEFLTPDQRNGIDGTLSASAEPSALPDPLRCYECTHADCGKFDGPRQVECRAMADNACARPGASS